MCNLKRYVVVVEFDEFGAMLLFFGFLGGSRWLMVCRLGKCSVDV